MAPHVTVHCEWRIHNIRSSLHVLVVVAVISYFQQKLVSFTNSGSFSASLCLELTMASAGWVELLGSGHGQHWVGFPPKFQRLRKRRALLSLWNLWVSQTQGISLHHCVETHEFCKLSCCFLQLIHCHSHCFVLVCPHFLQLIKAPWGREAPLLANILLCNLGTADSCSCSSQFCFQGTFVIGIHKHVNGWLGFIEWICSDMKSKLHICAHASSWLAGWLVMFSLWYVQIHNNLNHRMNR